MQDKLARRQFSRVGLGIFMFMFLQQVVNGIIIGIVSAYAPQIMETGWFMWTASYLPLYLIGFPACVLILRSIPDTLPELPEGYQAGGRGLSAGQLARLVLACIGITYSLNLLSMQLSALIEQLKGRPVTNMLEAAVTGSNPWLSFFVVVIVAPVMEEIVFRGFLYKKLIAYGEKTYVLLSALIFALFHVNFYQLLYAFALGALFAKVVCHTKSIRYTVILHLIINFLGSGVGTLLGLTGSEQPVMIWGVIVLALMVVGVAYCIVWLVRNRRNIRFAPPVLPMRSAALIWLNPGMILYLLLTIGLAVFAVML
jgi:membrane protease YdiL (CAAX protease family)